MKGKSSLTNHMKRNLTFAKKADVPRGNSLKPQHKDGCCSTRKGKK